ncbi:MAG: glycogen synthase GlgA [Deltaproteobacteria bacterium]|nr:glycogen synthase GlgA [Deltaproteobacteria bacterium]
MALNVVIAASEATPYAKTGGLADVVGALPAALKRLGCKVVLFLPYYRQVAQSGIEVEPAGLDISIPIGKREVKAQILIHAKGEVPVYFIKRDEFYDRSYLYGTPEGDYFDNLERYAFFSRCVLEILKARGFAPDVIHCNDWQTGLIPAYLKDIYKDDEYFSRTSTLFTIHNIAYQGLFSQKLYELTGLSPILYNPEGVEFWGQINLLKAGIVSSDVITTVSEAYSKEIQTPEYGYGLEGLLIKRKDDLHGVLNGVDYDEWNPEADPVLPANYSAENLKGKATCKRKVLKEFNLKLKIGVPVIGIISRLAAQKGFDILSEAMPELMKLNIGIVVIGTGDKKYQMLMEELAARYHHKLSVKIVFDQALSHVMEAGCDMLLMPSRYEPCGLNQIYSLRYGTIPVVRATGGLDDTVRDYKEGDGNGFKFDEYSAEALVAKVKEALEVYNDKEAWKELMRRGMAQDFSWESSAQKYLSLYLKAQENCLKVNQASQKKTQPTAVPAQKPSETK